jgi:hypothetical protein
MLFCFVIYSELFWMKTRTEGRKSFMPKINFPHAGHENHLCYLHNLGLLEADLDHYKDLVQGAQFICKMCGRAAKNADSLCKPEKL